MTHLAWGTNLVAATINLPAKLKGQSALAALVENPLIECTASAAVPSAAQESSFPD